MKRLKLATIALSFMFVVGLSACGEDAIMDEIIDNAELNSPTFETGNSDKKPEKPTSN